MAAVGPARAVYGTVLTGALLAAEGAGPEVDVGQLLLVVLVTVIVFWLAHAYSELVGARVVSGHRPHRAEVRAVLDAEWPLVAASFGPLAVVLAADLLGAGGGTAVTAGLWATTVALGGWALAAGRRAGMRGVELALYVLGSAALGGALVVLEAVVH